MQQTIDSIMQVGILNPAIIRPDPEGGYEIFKLLVLPLIVAVTLIQWVGIFFTQFSTAIFNLLAGLMFLITIAGWMFGISAEAETLRLLAVAFVVFIIPHIAEWLIIRIAVINYGLRDFIKS